MAISLTLHTEQSLEVLIFFTPFLRIDIPLGKSKRLTISRDMAKYKRGALTALQLVPSRSQWDNVQLHPISALHKHSPRGPEALRQICLFTWRVWNINTFGLAKVSHWQNEKLYLHSVPLCCATCGVCEVDVVTNLSGEEKKSSTGCISAEKLTSPSEWLEPMTQPFPIQGLDAT